MEPAEPVKLPVFVAATLTPAVLTPALLALFDTRFLPVFVADYLAVHLFVYGLVSLAILTWNGVCIRRVAWGSAAAFAAYGIFLFGGALDRYVASVHAECRTTANHCGDSGRRNTLYARDSMAIEGGRARVWRVMVARIAFLSSLGAAVALDFSRLFFLLIIIPVIVLFFAVFGTMAGWVGRRTQSPRLLASPLASFSHGGGVTFPIFAPD